MPIYATRCTHCGREDTVYRTVSNRDRDLPLCPDDDFPVERVVTAPYIAADMQPYQSMITGEMITSRSRHREHLRDHNCIEVGNETIKPKEKIDLSAETRKARKQKIIEQVNANK